MMLGVDRISLDDARAATPLTFQVDVSKPFRGIVTPRVEGGLGAYFLETVQGGVSIDFLLGGPSGRKETDTLFGGYLGGGMSFRVSNSTMLDFGARYQHAKRREHEVNLVTTDAGLTFRL
jgi:opacity protein-like surface antigen